MERRSFLTALAGLAAVPFVSAAAEAAPWVYLGRKSVHPFGDYDVLHVGPAAGLFSKLKFKITGNKLVLHRLRVEFANGAHQDVQVNWVIPQGGLTPTLDLPGNRRLIKKIRFWYTRPLNFKGDAYVTSWGRR